MWPFYNRTRKLSRAKERVVILGASRGVGLAIAHEYALAGARIFLVARREDMLAQAEEECKELSAKTQTEDSGRGKTILSARADLGAVDDMLALRAKVQEGNLYYISRKWTRLISLVSSLGWARHTGCLRRRHDTAALA